MAFRVLGFGGVGLRALFVQGLRGLHDFARPI